MLGHKDIQTTMIYTHVLKRNDIKVVSPLDRLSESSSSDKSPGDRSTSNVIRKVRLNEAQRSVAKGKVGDGERANGDCNRDVVGCDKKGRKFEVVKAESDRASEKLGNDDRVEGRSVGVAEKRRRIGWLRSWLLGAAGLRRESVAAT